MPAGGWHRFSFYPPQIDGVFWGFGLQPLAGHLPRETNDSLVELPGAPACTC